MPAPRPSSLHDQPDQWRITEDGHPFADGDRLYNYYDCEWGTVHCGDGKEWFTFISDAGKKRSLNAVRVAKSEPQEERMTRHDRTVWSISAAQLDEIAGCTVPDEVLDEFARQFEVPDAVADFLFAAGFGSDEDDA